MAAFTTTDYTVTIEDRHIEGKHRRNRCKVVLATDATYPSAGIPAPTFGQLGMVRNIDYVIVTDGDATNHTLKYDQAAHTFQLFKLSTASIVAQDLLELATTATVGSTVLGTIYVEAVGW